MSLFKITFARTGQETSIEATDWRDAARQAGRDDACLVERIGDRAYEATFDPDSPTAITCRVRRGTDEDAFRFALDSVIHAVDGEARGRARIASA
ncbi:hypothetical protein R3F64_03195 [Halomonas sp. 5021]|uniref:hypothetical protein n=1 Tax=Halomonas sp. 5021 TaxID=3082156 RepID=UPI002FC9CFC5